MTCPALMCCISGSMDATLADTYQDMVLLLHLLFVHAFPADLKASQDTCDCCENAPRLECSLPPFPHLHAGRRTCRKSVNGMASVWISPIWAVGNPGLPIGPHLAEDISAVQPLHSNVLIETSSLFAPTTHCGRKDNASTALILQDDHRNE